MGSALECADHNALLKILLDQRVEDHNGDHAYHDAGVLDQLGQFQCGVRGVGVGTLLSLVHQQNVAQNDLQCLEAIITDVDEAGEIVVPACNHVVQHND